jgi:hypothetical protein
VYHLVLMKLKSVSIPNDILKNLDQGTGYDCSINNK